MDLSRTEILLGSDGVKKLKNARVAVFGIGGVGGYAAEALARSGVGALDLIDNDTVSESNINRQIIALNSTVGKLDFRAFDYVLDAIDTVSGKLTIIECAKSVGIPVISCMGAGNKLDGTAFEVTDIENTSVCPLAKVMRKELKARHISGVTVVYSREQPKKGIAADSDVNGKRAIPGSVSFVPSIVGLLAAGKIIKDLSGVN